MKTPLVLLLGLLSLAALTGCEQMHYRQYGGPASSWPTGSAYTDRVFDVPVYRGWPEKSYVVLGSIEFTNANVDWNQGDMKQAARMAKEAGGDAIIIIPKGADQSPSTSTARQALGMVDARQVGVVVKWE
ncbi:MAG: hypothetical protein KDM81_00800 [Verrucomicrobiae bacterium]|nr:hypothetical protein [Verrucomicrobiae bacterium]MCP5523482.1 hypothetical protein [Verrucomicrobiales bacterium]